MLLPDPGLERGDVEDALEDLGADQVEAGAVDT
jgi:hypothetical protein